MRIQQQRPSSDPFGARYVFAASWLLVAACGGDSAEAPLPGAQAGASSVVGASAGAPAGAAGSASPSMGAAGSMGGRPSMSGSTSTRGGNMAAAGASAGVAGASTDPSGGASGAPAGASGDATGSAGMAAAGSGGAPAAEGGFPRSDEINIKAKGPYTVMKYTDGLDDPEYSSSVMYYPSDATPPFAAVALSPGFTASGTDYEFVGDMLASHGIAVLLTTPTATDIDQPPARGVDLVAAVQHLVMENDRSGSPLMGKLATDRICVTGQSMGGGGSLFAANELGDMIRCVVPLQPWQPGGSFPRITAPTMIVGAAADTIASVSGHARGHYASIPDSTEKFLVVFEGDHYLSTDRTSGSPSSQEAKATPEYDLQAAYMIPFYKLFLESDERYRPYLYDEAMRSTTSVTSYDHSK
jgi:predicted dienelactone hydrolase